MSYTSPYVVALIQKDAVENLPVVVFAHEVPVLGLVHGEHKVFVDENADLPAGVTQGEFEPEDEYARLEQRYGDDKDTKQSYAKLAYGSLRGFVELLEQLAEPQPAPRGRKAKAKAEELVE